MSERQPGSIAIALPRGQITRTLREKDLGPAGEGASAPEAAGVPRGAADAHDHLSRSLVRGLALLAAFEPGGGERGIVELAAELGLSPSTAHRYARTLVAVGVLQHSSVTRRYRLAPAAAPPARA
ncbi:MAG TPA: helix-turn-helix domain-containing protein [Solirubrobacteraceae bacterium]|nr:helix-turn-helix domain-containing protein [Solirubrobacteraceae bacterium]